ncbi:MAG: alpha,alpha-trehalase TreF, partial [Pseudomonadota bacterium]
MSRSPEDVGSLAERRPLRSLPAPDADEMTPADRYAELFVAVQRGGVFPDSKTFVDCAPRMEPQGILDRYRAQRNRPGFDLSSFVGEHFIVQHSVAKAYVSPQGQSLAAHIDSLWDILTRRPSEHPVRGSLLPLPCDYVVPGGRFTELYYWDSYFTMLGLSASGRPHLLRAMLENFAHLIETCGFIPNGTRTYYLSRSQPPVFALMVELGESDGVCEAQEFLPHLLAEHRFWMAGGEGLKPGEQCRRVVALPDGSLLNRYWDDRDGPREEAWREDVATAASSQRPAAEVYRDLRAACESGWDFSSRWLSDNRLTSIRTTCIVPVDLNAFLHRLESLIARISHTRGDGDRANEFERRARDRRIAFDAVCWNAARGAYFDYDWERGAQRTLLNAATVAPLFVGMASAEQAAAVTEQCRAHLLAPGGFATTLEASGEQWDRPNGWAPIQWMAVGGFERYGHHSLASAIRSRWLRTVGELYGREGKVVEKYAIREQTVQQTKGGGGGEYPLQDGFGWTNGVTRRWLQSRPQSDVAAGGPP